MERFLSELKRRNVLRVAAFYAAAGWLLVQIATQVLPVFDAPTWTMRVVVVAVVLGFPFALVFSWFYELTPDGLKRENEFERSQSITRSTGRKLDRWIIGVLAAAVVALLANQFVPHKEALGKAIAVLPLVNDTGDPNNEYFSDGLSEELISALAQIKELKVIGRTSSFHFKKTNEESKVIGAALGVGYLLEGQCAQVCRARAHRCQSRTRRGWCERLVPNLRPHPAGYLRGAGGDRAIRGRRTQGSAAGRCR